MWPFQTKARASLVERIEALERGHRDLRTDWDVTYDKFAMLLSRWVKHAKAHPAALDGEKPVRDLVSRLGGR